jgi:hypothetical protein
MLKNILSFLKTHEKKIFILLIITIFFRATNLLINRSESLEGKVFLLLKGWSYEVGDIVGIDPYFLKKVGGVEGDKIRIKENEVFVENIRIGPLFEKNSEGEPLHPIQDKKFQRAKSLFMELIPSLLIVDTLSLVFWTRKESLEKQ